jgi:integrase
MGRGAVIRLRYVHAFVDKTGRQRFYFRRHSKNTALPGLPGSPEFMAAYAVASGVEAPERESRPVAAPGTFAALAARYFASPKYLGRAASTRKHYRQVIERFLAEHGTKRLRTIERKHIDAIIGKMADRPGAGIVLLKRISTLLNYAIAIGWLEHNPAARAATYRSKPRHTWTEAEIATFEARWPVGTKQRLAFALLLYTGQRGSDVHLLTWPDTEGFHLAQQKTGTPLVIPVHPELVAVLAAAKREHAIVLASDHGRPFSVKGFGHMMSAAIKAAGLPNRCKAHGLRKAMARRLAEGDATAKQIAAVTGHKTLAEVERYTTEANQPRLAQQAFEKQVANIRLANRKPQNG